MTLPTLTNRTSFAANNGTLTMAAFQWNSNERGAGKLPHSPQLFGVLRICCHASGVPVPGSGVGHSALLLLQGPHQTTGLGVGLWVCMHVWERWGCACVHSAHVPPVHPIAVLLLSGGVLHMQEQTAVQSSSFCLPCVHAYHVVLTHMYRMHAVDHNW